MESRAPQFAAWLDEFFASYYRHRPVNATFIGVHNYDHRLPDFSPQGVDECVAEMETLLKTLRTLSQEPLTEAQSMDRKLAEGFLAIQLWEYGSNHFHRGNPSLYTGEAIFGVLSLFRHVFAPLEQRLEAAIDRMNAIPSLLNQGKANVRQAPPAWTERATRECTGALSFLGDGLEMFMRDNGVDSKSLRNAADTASAAFRDFQSYLETELRRRPTEEYACGEEAFNLMLRRGHFLDMDASEVEIYAWDQLRGSEAKLEAHAGDFGASDWRSALAQLDDHHPTVERYYPRHWELWEACRAAAEEHELLTWPDCAIDFVPRPSWARGAAPHLYFLPYHSAPAFDPLPSVDYLVPPIDVDMPPETQERLLRAANDSVIKLNHVVHHGSIGHHVQNWYAYQAPSRIGQIAAVDCASRLALFCGGTMAEGWATYTTGLMDEVGFLTPLEHYSLHHARLRASARAIVDVNLHIGKFAFAEAEAFYRQRVAMSQEASHAEAVKNSMFPGAAVMYLMGSDMIRRLREELSTKQGDAFNLKQFHDRFLSYGSVPVSLIREAMNR